MMACIVVFCTTYALLLPAVTLEKTAEGGLEEHQHEEGCYEEQLVCGQEESGEHRHTDICYQKVLVCGKEVHIHSADCFQKKALDGAGDGNFGMYDTAEETGMPPLEQAENAGDTAVNESAADSALDLEALGVTTAYLNEGTFTLDEIKTPTGYAALDQPITITVTTTVPGSYDLTVTSGGTVYYIALNGPEGFYTTTEATTEAMARITVKNRTVQNLKVVKVGVDGGARTPLSGVHFALYEQVHDSEGHVRPAYNPKTGFEDLVTDENGILGEITMSLGKGTYYLREKEAPSGYKKLSEDLCFTIGQDGTVSIHNDGYSNWLTRDTSVPGAVSYQISIENTSLGITLRKTDESGKALTGSQFVLYKKNEAGSFVIATGIDGIGEGGLINLTDKTETTLSGMGNGIYKLSETNAPSGYIILTKDIYFSVSNGTVTLIDEDGATAMYSDISLLDQDTTIAVKNNPGASLPSTGGPGTGCFRMLGLLIIAGAGLLLWKKGRLLW